MSEEIQLIYTPIQGTGLFGAFTAYHGTLVYTNSSGVSQYIDGGPSIAAPASLSGKLYDTAAGAYAAFTGLASPNGTLLCSSGSAAQVESGLHLTAEQFDSEIAGSNPSDVLVYSQSSLASTWATMTSACSQINALGVPYSAATQNSDSVWATVVTAGKLAIPADTGVLDSLWNPATGDILKTSFTSASDETHTTSSTSNGTTTVDVTEDNSAGSAVDSQTYQYKAGNTSVSGTLTTTSADVSATASESVAGGVTTDVISGTAPDRLGTAVPYGQTVTTSATGAVTDDVTSVTSAAIMGPVQAVDFNNATIDLGARAQAAISGDDNTLLNSTAQVGKGGASIGANFDILSGTGDVLKNFYADNLTVSNDYDVCTVDTPLTNAAENDDSVTLASGTTADTVNASYVDFAVGSNTLAQVVGSDNFITESGTDNTIVASNSTFDFVGADTGDIIIGSGNTDEGDGSGLPPANGDGDGDGDGDSGDSGDSGDLAVHVGKATGHHTVSPSLTERFPVGSLMSRVGVRGTALIGTESNTYTGGISNTVNRSVDQLVQAMAGLPGQAAVTTPEFETGEVLGKSATLSTPLSRAGSHLHI